MDPQQERRDHIARAAKSRGIAQVRAAERATEIAGKQAQLKREAQERREKKADLGQEPRWSRRAG
jgi:hypothetical protein